MHCPSLVVGCLAALVFQVASAQTPEDARATVRRGLDYLTSEVPAWSRENHCYSCHNNADGARALIAAQRAGWPIEPSSLQDTLDFLSDVGRWEKNGGQGDFNDLELATVQFTWTLACLGQETRTAAVNKPPADRLQQAWGKALQRVLKQQSESGCWTVQGASPVGTPTTQATVLSTALMREALQQDLAAPAAVRAALVRADSWLAQQQPRNIVEAAALLWSAAGRSLAPQRAQRRAALDLLAAAQQPHGGWGPYRQAPAEVFDTSLAIWALAADMRAHPHDTQQRQGMIQRGQRYLIQQQLPGGGWPATTRPPTGQSYAQHISTSGWALIAFIESGVKPPPGASPP